MVCLARLCNGGIAGQKWLICLYRVTQHVLEIVMWRLFQKFEPAYGARKGARWSTTASLTRFPRWHAYLLGIRNVVGNGVGDRMERRTRGCRVHSGVRPQKSYGPVSFTTPVGLSNRQHQQHKTQSSAEIQTARQHPASLTTPPM